MTNQTNYDNGTRYSGLRNVALSGLAALGTLGLMGCDQHTPEIKPTEPVVETQKPAISLDEAYAKFVETVGATFDENMKGFAERSGYSSVAEISELDRNRLYRNARKKHKDDPAVASFFEQYREDSLAVRNALAENLPWDQSYRVKGPLYNSTNGWVRTFDDAHLTMLRSNGTADYVFTDVLVVPIGEGKRLAFTDDIQPDGNTEWVPMEFYSPTDLGSVATKKLTGEVASLEEQLLIVKDLQGQVPKGVEPDENLIDRLNLDKFGFRSGSPADKLHLLGEGSGYVSAERIDNMEARVESEIERIGALLEANE